MQAVTVAKTSADPRDLVVQDMPVPEPDPGQVRVAVHAVSINPVDWKLTESGHPRWTMPHVLGLDAAGVIEAVGSAMAAAGSRASASSGTATCPVRACSPTSPWPTPMSWPRSPGT